MYKSNLHLHFSQSWLLTCWMELTSTIVCFIRCSDSFLIYCIKDNNLLVSTLLCFTCVYGDEELCMPWSSGVVVWYWFSLVVTYECNCRLAHEVINIVRYAVPTESAQCPQSWDMQVSDRHRIHNVRCTCWYHDRVLDQYYTKPRGWHFKLIELLG